MLGERNRLRRPLDLEHLDQAGPAEEEEAPFVVGAAAGRVRVGSAEAWGALLKLRVQRGWQKQKESSVILFAWGACLS